MPMMSSGGSGTSLPYSGGRTGTSMLSSSSGYMNASGKTEYQMMLERLVAQQGEASPAARELRWYMSSGRNSAEREQARKQRMLFNKESPEARTQRLASQYANYMGSIGGGGGNYSDYMRQFAMSPREFEEYQSSPLTKWGESLQKQSERPLQDMKPKQPGGRFGKNLVDPMVRVKQDPQGNWVQAEPGERNKTRMVRQSELIGRGKQQEALELQKLNPLIRQEEREKEKQEISREKFVNEAAETARISQQTAELVKRLGGEGGTAYQRAKSKEGIDLIKSGMSAEQAFNALQSMSEEELASEARKTKAAEETYKRQQAGRYDIELFKMDIAEINRLANSDPQKAAIERQTKIAEVNRLIRQQQADMAGDNELLRRLERGGTVEDKNGVPITLEEILSVISGRDSIIDEYTKLLNMLGSY